ncbi:MAG TPA: hypothetical protein VD794_02325 [Flavisolibacter sp.]|nr:hypothetical protein [Flavisolibacter sp.]
MKTKTLLTLFLLCTIISTSNFDWIIDTCSSLDIIQLLNQRLEIIEKRFDDVSLIYNKMYELINMCVRDLSVLDKFRFMELFSENVHDTNTMRIFGDRTFHSLLYNKYMLLYFSEPDPTNKEIIFNILSGYLTDYRLNIERIRIADQFFNGEYIPTDPRFRISSSLREALYDTVQKTLRLEIQQVMNAIQVK